MPVSERSSVPIDDLPDFCRRMLELVERETWGKYGLTALNICNMAENSGYERPKKRAVEIALAKLDGVDKVRRYSWTFYRLNAS